MHAQLDVIVRISRKSKFHPQKNRNPNYNLWWKVIILFYKFLYNLTSIYHNSNTHTYTGWNIHQNMKWCMIEVYIQGSEQNESLVTNQNSFPHVTLLQLAISGGYINLWIIQTLRMSNEHQCSISHDFWNFDHLCWIRHPTYQ